MSVIESRDQLQIWKLCQAADLPKPDIMRLLDKLGLPVTVDHGGDVCTSRSEFRRLLQEVAGE